MTATALVPSCTMYIPATMLPQVLKICSRPNGTLARSVEPTSCRSKEKSRFGGMEIGGCMKRSSAGACRALPVARAAALCDNDRAARTDAVEHAHHKIRDRSNQRHGRHRASPVAADKRGNAHADQHDR